MMPTSARRALPSTLLASLLPCGTAAADAPRVAVDIAPVHSLVARVMEGVGEPELVVSPGGTPHEYTLRPSEARALRGADAVFWVGPELTPWLENALGTLSGDARIVALSGIDGTLRLEVREGALFETHEHGEDHGSEAGHDEEHARADEHDGGHDDGHDGGHDEEHGPGHAGDPHAWLSPDNASVWLGAVADTLAVVDPERADVYRANAATAREELDTLSVEIERILDPVRGRGFIVFHDAYQYFERAFDIPASGAISVSDATDPSPARLSAIRGRVTDEAANCVLSEPQFDPDLVAVVVEGTDVRTGVLDPLGSSLEPGPELYPRLLHGLATTLAECLA